MDASSFTAQPSTSSDMGNTQVDDDPIPSTSISESTLINTVCSKQETETKACYMCNVRVPVTYIYKHRNSIKHKMWVRLRHIIQERNRLHNKQQEADDGYYYCEACDCYVEILYRSSHEDSLSHLDEQENLELLISLVSKTNDIAPLVGSEKENSNLEKDEANNIKGMAKKYFAEKRKQIENNESFGNLIRMLKEKFQMKI